MFRECLPDSIQSGRSCLPMFICPGRINTTFQLPKRKLRRRVFLHILCHSIRSTGE